MVKIVEHLNWHQITLFRERERRVRRPKETRRAIGKEIFGHSLMKCPDWRRNEVLNDLNMVSKVGFRRKIEKMFSFRSEAYNPTLRFRAKLN